MTKNGKGRYSEKDRATATKQDGGGENSSDNHITIHPPLSSNHQKRTRRLPRKGEAPRSIASRTGWSMGRELLKRHTLKQAYNGIKAAGLTVWMDNECVYGPAEQSSDAILIMAEMGDPLSRRIYQDFCSRGVWPMK